MPLHKVSSGQVKLEKLLDDIYNDRIVSQILHHKDGENKRVPQINTDEINFRRNMSFHPLERLQRCRQSLFHKSEVKGAKTEYKFFLLLKIFLEMYRSVSAKIGAQR